MPRPKAPRSALEAAKAAVARGASQADAASRHRVGKRTLERALAEDRAKKATKPRKAAPRAGKGRKGPRAENRPGGAERGAPSLLETLVAELRAARDARSNSDNSDGENRAWAKTIRELVSAIERIAPPPPVPPDQVAGELRRLDGITIKLIEQFLPDAIKPEEL